VLAEASYRAWLCLRWEGRISAPQKVARRRDHLGVVERAPCQRGQQPPPWPLWQGYRRGAWQGMRAQACGRLWCLGSEGASGAYRGVVTDTIGRGRGMYVTWVRWGVGSRQPAGLAGPSGGSCLQCLRRSGWSCRFSLVLVLVASPRGAWASAATGT
jgi:hypothetical protein